MQDTIYTVNKVATGNKQEKNQSLTEREILSICQADYTKALTYASNKLNKIRQWRKEYDGLPYGNERTNPVTKEKIRSSYVARDMKKHSAWLQASLIDPFTSTPDIVRCFPAIPSSTKAAQASEVVLNAQFCRQFNRFNFMSEVISVLETDGICVIKTGWDYVEEERKVKYSVDTPLSMLGQPLIPEIPQEQLQAIAEQNPEEAQMLQMAMTPAKDELGRPVLDHYEEFRNEVVPIINQPTAIVCRNEDIFIDPTCLGNFDNAQFIIHRYATDLTTLKLDGRYKNLDDIAIPAAGPTDTNYTRNESFVFEDKSRGKFLLYEYWGYLDVDGDGIAEPYIVAYVDNVIVRCEPNPYPDKKPPFIVSPFLPKPFDIYGEPNIDLIRDTQKVKTAIYRGIIDSMALSNAGQMAYTQGAISEADLAKMLRGENFSVQGDPKAVIQPVTYGQLPSSVFNVLQMLDSEATQLTGVNTFGQQQTSNRIGADNASKGLLDGGNLRKLQIVKSISENLVKPLLRKWLEYDAWLLEDEQVFRLTGGEHFETIKRDDLYGRIDVDLTISTNEDNAVRTNQLAFLLQTIGPNEDPNIRKMIMAEIMRLHKMPELATRLENYQPQPDPMVEMARRLELEKLRAEIMELQANAGKIEQDGLLKNAKAQAEGTRAELTKAQTDKANLDFIQQQQGLDKIAKFNELQAQLESKERIASMQQQSLIDQTYMKLAAEQDKMQNEIEKARINKEKAEIDLQKKKEGSDLERRERITRMKNSAYSLKGPSVSEPRAENIRK